jgi:carbon-monoxide dehydrogenase large subunit
MRGFGMPEMHAGLEQCIDELAYAMHMDPVQFRKLNCIQTGDTLVTGMTMHPTGLSECLVKAAEAIRWGRKDPPSAPNKRRGKGIALMWKAPAMPPNAGSSAKVALNEDGTVTVSVGGQEIGQGSFTVAAQIAAASLGVPYDWVRVTTNIDTDFSPYEWQTVASRLTWCLGNAVAAAGRDARQQIIEMVAKAWSENP